MIKYIFLAFVAICAVLACFGIYRFLIGKDQPKSERPEKVKVTEVRSASAVLTPSNDIQIIPAYRVSNGFVKKDAPFDYYRQGITTEFGRVEQIKGASMVCVSAGHRREIYFDLVDVQQCEFRGEASIAGRKFRFTDLGTFSQGDPSPFGGVVTYMGAHTIEVFFEDQTRLILVAKQGKPAEREKILDLPEIAGMELK